jgi:hypothetical protein
MGVQPVYGEGPHRLLRAGKRTARGKVTIFGISNRLNNCVTFIVYTLHKCRRGLETHTLNLSKGKLLFSSRMHTCIAIMIHGTISDNQTEG